MRSSLKLHKGAKGCLNCYNQAKPVLRNLSLNLTTT